MISRLCALPQLEDLGPELLVFDLVVLPFRVITVFHPGFLEPEVLIRFLDQLAQRFEQGMVRRLMPKFLLEVEDGLPDVPVLLNDFLEAVVSSLTFALIAFSLISR